MKSVTLLAILALALPSPLWASSAETLRNPQLESPTGLEEITRALDPTRSTPAAGLEERGGVVTKERAAVTQVEADIVTGRFWEPIGAFIGEFRIQDPEANGVIISGAIEGTVSVAAALGRAGVPVALVIEDATQRAAIATALDAMTATQGDWLKNGTAGELQRRFQPQSLPLVVTSDPETARRVLEASGVTAIATFINFSPLTPKHTAATIIELLQVNHLLPQGPAEPLLAAGLEEAAYLRQFEEFYL